MSEALAILLRINMAVAAAVLLVMALRLPIRRLFGARIAYGLWSLAPLAALAMLPPARVTTVAAPAASWSPRPTMILEAGQAAAQAPAAPDLWPDLWAAAAVLWILGGLASLGWLAWRQAEFGRAARHGLAGPAVLGLLRPRIVTPFDFARRYTPREQLVVLAHEETHIERRDCHVNAAVALARCVNWFNPAVHLAAHYLRIDQELACDAQVVAAHPSARRAYAEAMLKTQLAARPLPIGCYWPAQSAHPLAERIRLLSRRDPGRLRRGVGIGVVALAGIGAAWSAWAARPAEVVQVAVPAPAVTAAATTGLGRPVAPIATQAPAAHPAKLPAARAQAQAPETPAAASSLTTTDPQEAQTPILTSADMTPPAAAPILGDRKIYGVAERSAVEPGAAVRVLATMTDREGVPLTTDLTAFGSQTLYRTGYVWRKGSRYALFTAVAQHGDRLWITASLNRRFTPDVTGGIALAPGQTGHIVLGDGQVVTVTGTVRAETLEEAANGQRALRNWRPPASPQFPPHRSGGWFS